MADRRLYSTVFLLTLTTILILSIGLDVTAAGAEGGEPTEVEAGGGLGDWIGWSDAVILTLLAIGGVYYYFNVYTAKSDSAFSPNIKPISVPGAASSSADDGSFVKKMQKTGRNVVVFYGSQTGTGEELAGRLAKDATRYGMKGMPMDPEECDMEDLDKLREIDNHLAIFCLATYGEGDPTDNAQELFEFLQRGDADMSGINYAVFGLGNKTYEHYNEMGIFCDKKMEELGGKRIYTLGLGDDDGNLEEDFMLWREGFWPAVCDAFNIESIGEDISTRQYRLTVHDDIDRDRVFKGEMARLKSYVNQKSPFDPKNPYLAPVAVNTELHKGGSRSCRHIEFDISSSKLRYEAGDHAAVYATNDTNIVVEIGRILEVDLDTVFTLTNVDEDSSKKHPFPCPTTYRTALTHYVDIITPVRTHVLKELAEYCSDQKDKDFLKGMTSAGDESRKKYSEWIMGDHRSVLDVLKDCPSCKPPLDHLMELLPRLQARYYSISSSPKSDAGRVSITAVVVDYTTRIGRQVKGVATNYLKVKEPINGTVAEEDHVPPPRVPMFIRKSQLRLPHRPTTPVVMIGPGTGVAPFRGFIQDRHAIKTQGKEIGPMIMYFGCRTKAEDFIYQDELEAWKEAGTITELHVAFSREQTEKVYVQHLLKRNAVETWKLLEQGAHIYVCGDARSMAKEVNATLAAIVETEGGKSADEAKQFIKRMESQKRYQADVWS